MYSNMWLIYFAFFSCILFYLGCCIFRILLLLSFLNSFVLSPTKKFDLIICIADMLLAGFSLSLFTLLYLNSHFTFALFFSFYVYICFVCLSLWYFIFVYIVSFILFFSLDYNPIGRRANLFMLLFLYLALALTLLHVDFFTMVMLYLSVIVIYKFININTVKIKVNTSIL